MYSSKQFHFAIHTVTLHWASDQIMLVRSLGEALMPALMAAFLLTLPRYNSGTCHLTVMAPACRVYALFVTDRVCAEPLTDAVHFNDLLHANPQHVEATARLLKSLALGTNQLYSEMQLLRNQQAPKKRLDRLTLGVPYSLHNTLRRAD